MDSKRQAKRKHGHAKSRAIGSSSRVVNLRLPFAGGWLKRQVNDFVREKEFPDKK